jgi:hypothetical protein
MKAAIRLAIDLAVHRGKREPVVAPISPDAAFGAPPETRTSLEDAQ